MRAVVAIRREYASDILGSEAHLSTKLEGAPSILLSIGKAAGMIPDKRLPVIKIFLSVEIIHRTGGHGGPPLSPQSFCCLLTPFLVKIRVDDSTFPIKEPKFNDLRGRRAVR